ncbi:HD domain-containing protein [Mucilaginibacter sp. KACC 22773]|uniref:HD domain-containing protein n=1 Tax=Mucilaginibacter sp. KACC 22773 TaxID=3025671 RepID=UPI002366416A|nr:HD domain-containing protein [Mucilaginibacter sp. KACC 22773]WDF77099.1 HD domain-containing protein [Mucilaginibacter sp. KACC 22773]
MDFEQLQKQIDFIHEIDKVKYIQRKTRLFNSDRAENDAEHSWHLALMALILSGHRNEDIDLLKVIKMLLIHDLVEIDAGDIFLYETTTSHTNTVAELAAAKRIFGILPENQAQELIQIWEEFEAGESAESKFARAMDRFEPLLQNRSNKGGTWKEFNVPYHKVIEKKSIIKAGSNVLWNTPKSYLTIV